MSLTSAEFNDKATSLLKGGEWVALLKLFEDSFSQLSNQEKLLMGVLLLMPPFGDSPAAAEIFDALLEEKGQEQREAAVWAGYAHDFYPVHERFVIKLEQSVDWVVASYMLANYYKKLGDYELALEYINRSLNTEFFPNNLLLKAHLDTSLTRVQKRDIYEQALNLVDDPACEHKQYPEVLEELYKDYWNELVLGKQMTTIRSERLREKMQRLGEKGE